MQGIARKAATNNIASATMASFLRRTFRYVFVLISWLLQRP